MKLGIIIPLLLILAGFGLRAQEFRAHDFNRANFYAVMASGQLERIDQELERLDHDSLLPGKKAYEGALMMRKAGLVSRAGEKLRSFKTGRGELESAIARDSSNGEYRFLRLMIQEHAPGIVKYSSNIKQDRDLILRTFSGLPPSVQKAIIDYSKNSKTLHPDDFDPKKN